MRTIALSSSCLRDEAGFDVLHTYISDPALALCYICVMPYGNAV